MRIIAEMDWTENCVLMKNSYELYTSFDAEKGKHFVRFKKICGRGHGHELRWLAEVKPQSRSNYNLALIDKFYEGMQFTCFSGDTIVASGIVTFIHPDYDEANRFNENIC